MALLEREGKIPALEDLRTDGGDLQGSRGVGFEAQPGGI